MPSQRDRADVRMLRHDLRTPLNHVIGYTELLADELEGRDDAASLVDDLAKIRNAAKDLEQRIDRTFEILLLQGLDETADHDLAMPKSVAPMSTRAMRRSTEVGRLLVVDDDDTSQDLLSRALREAGHRVACASSGAEALSILEMETYDLVLLDVVMPEMDGYQVLAKLRQTYLAMDLPVVMVTGQTDSEDVVTALESGANDYVTKPIDVPVALARIASQLRLKQANERVVRLAREVALRNQFIKRVFGRYVTEQVVEELLQKPSGLELGGEKRKATILISHLQGFANVADTLDPTEVVRLLNVHFAKMTEIVQQYHGTIGEFASGSILVIFGAPTVRSDDALRAVACAAQMQLAMKDVNEILEGIGLCSVEMGIGVHTGEVVAGSIGSQMRATYGVVGRSVTLATRIASYAIGGQVYVSSATLSECDDALDVGEPLTAWPEGASEPMTLHELHGTTQPLTLRLERAEPRPTALATPRSVRFSLAHEGEPALHEGHVVAAAGAYLELDTSHPLLVLSSLHLHFVGAAGTPLAGEASARVVRAAGGSRALLYLTSVSPDIQTHLAGLPRAGSRTEERS